MTNITDYKFTWLYYYDSDADGLIITKPIEPSKYQDMLKGMKALEIDFSKSAFNKSFNANAFVEELLQYCKLEFLNIKYGSNLSCLPPSINTHPLRFLKINADGLTNFSNTVSKISSLEELDIRGKHFQLGAEFSKLSNLKFFNLHAEKVDDLQVIGSLQNLKHLTLDVKEMNDKPEWLNGLSTLSKLTISGCKIQELPADLDLPSLTTLYISNMPHLRHIPKALLESQNLQEINLRDIGQETQLTLPESLEMKKVEELYINSCSLLRLPEMYLPNLKELRLYDLPIKQVLKQVKGAQQLETLGLIRLQLENEDLSNLESRNITKYFGPFITSNNTADYSIWANLQEVYFSEGGEKELTLDLSKNLQLESFNLNDIANISLLEKLPSSITKVSIKNCQNLTSIDLSGTYPGLNDIMIWNAEKLGSIQFEGTSLPNLESINLRNCNKLKTLPSDLLLAPQLRAVYINQCQALSQHEKLQHINDIIDQCHKEHLSIDERKALGYWLFYSPESDLPDDDILHHSLSSLRCLSDVIIQLISKYFHLFNTKGLTLEKVNKAEMKGKKVSIVGKTFATKTSLKQDMKELGLTYTLKVENADYVLTAKKATLNRTLLKEDVIFFTETDLNAYLEQHQPKFLQEEDGAEHLDGLLSILRSTDPDSEMLALEMLKTGGLRDEVLGECLVIAKTSSDKAVRNKFKAFLKGKVTPEAAALLSANVRFDLPKHDPFWTLKHLPDALLGKFALAFYFRTQRFWEKVLLYHQTDSDIRFQIIREHVVPKVLLHPHYVKLPYNLTKDELGYILSLPELKGNLKRLQMYTSIDTFPDNIKEHITLKILEVQGNLNCKKMPEILFELKRLSEIRISSDTMEEIGENILELKLLKELLIYNKKKIHVPECIKSLPKLKRIYLSTGNVELMLM
ncbi:hypothetical protein V6R21_03055 [Limibacter armeniacum]|uniref:leucine-rich repeat domain-containing protein n=1 Tax=Limibacter armeniacum TaxID=466084 RepID=UPI002FE578F7